MQELRVGDVFVSRSGRYEITIEAIQGAGCYYSVCDLRTKRSRPIEGSSLYAIHRAMNSPQWDLKILDMENE